MKKYTEFLWELQDPVQHPSAPMTLYISGMDMTTGGVDTLGEINIRATNQKEVTIGHHRIKMILEGGEYTYVMDTADKFKFLNKYPLLMIIRH